MQLSPRIGITPEPIPADATPPKRSTQKRPPSAIELARAARRHYWQQVFADVHQLLGQGISKHQIAKHLGISERVVRKYSHMDHLPKKQSPKFGPRLMDPYRDQVRQWLLEEPTTTLVTVHRRLQARGFTGSRATVYQAVRQLRVALKLPVPAKNASPKPIPLTPHQLATWILTPRLPAHLQSVLQQVGALNPILEQTIGLAQDFVFCLRTHKPHHLIPWIEAVMLTDIRALKSFTKGLLNDFDAIVAAFTSTWSNGQVEGQINRLKLIKRQMYGRANFDLLRLRVLYRGCLTT